MISCVMYLQPRIQRTCISAGKRWTTEGFRGWINVVGWFILRQHSQPGYSPLDSRKQVCQYSRGFFNFSENIQFFPNIRIPQYFRIFFDILRIPQYFRIFINISQIPQYFRIFINISQIPQYFQIFINISQIPQYFRKASCYKLWWRRRRKNKCT